MLAVRSPNSTCGDDLVLRNPAGRLYVGQTSDLTRRLQQHLSGESRWTSSRGPWSLVYSEEFGLGRLVESERTSRNRSGRPIRAEHYTRGQGVRFYERQAGWQSAFIEEPFAASKHHGNTHNRNSSMRPAERSV
ncbi:MAG: hypothetical protein GEU28_14200 [Dehalococcoidia bacterium]|nr:hypothetical protein [Dehalococcoidia bacterium]